VFFVSSAIFLVVVCFFYFFRCKFGLVGKQTKTSWGAFGDCLLLCIFVLIIFIRNCFICAIVGLFVLLKGAKSWV